MKLEIVQNKQSENLDISNLSVDLNLILSAAVDLLKIKQSNSISLSFLSQKEIQSLNNEFRSKNKPTDVLSWGYIDDLLLPHELAGDIYVCLDIAKNQASEKKHSLNYEILFLFSHGLLHVFGYDHQNDQEENEMNDLQQAILNYDTSAVKKIGV